MLAQQALVAVQALLGHASRAVDAFPSRGEMGHGGGRMPAERAVTGIGERGLVAVLRQQQPGVHQRVDHLRAEARVEPVPQDPVDRADLAQRQDRGGIDLDGAPQVRRMREREAMVTSAGAGLVVATCSARVSGRPDTTQFASPLVSGTPEVTLVPQFLPPSTDTSTLAVSLEIPPAVQMRETDPLLTLPPSS